MTTCASDWGLESCLASVAAAHPEAPVSVIEDAGLRPDVAAWINRYLRAGTALGTDWVVKIDPDTRVHRAFGPLPIADAVGYEIPCWLGTYLHGGCRATTRALAVSLVDAQAMEAAVASMTDRDRARAQHPRFGLSEDVVLAIALKAAGAATAHWPEVSPLPCPPGTRFAATHGHKRPLTLR